MIPNIENFDFPTRSELFFPDSSFVFIRSAYDQSALLSRNELREAADRTGVALYDIGAASLCGGCQDRRALRG